MGARPHANRGRGERRQVTTLSLPGDDSHRNFFRFRKSILSALMQ
jgi:hypothetical protein